MWILERNINSRCKLFPIFELMVKAIIPNHYAIDDKTSSVGNILRAQQI